MTPREVWERIPMKVVILVVGVVIAFVQLQGQVANKADKEEVVRKADRLEVVELTEAVAKVARAQQAMLYLLCRQPANRSDYVCQPP